LLDKRLAMQVPPASREEVVEMLGEVDTSYVDRVLDTGASLDEIGEAIDHFAALDEPRQLPSSTRVADVEKILEELMTPDGQTPRVFPIRGFPVFHPL
jgi:hypothetical protein